MTSVEENCDGFRLLWVRFQRLKRGPAGRKAFLFTWIVAVLVITILVYRYHTQQKYDTMVSSITKRIIRFCNPPAPVLGMEGQIPVQYAKFKLKQVQIAVRHGDRSSIVTEIPSATIPHFSCSLVTRNAIHSEQMKKLKDMENVFVKRRKDSNGKIVADGFKLEQAVRCEPGQLTAIGYLQHIYLGEFIYNAYHSILDLSLATVQERQVLVFTTPIKRTQETAAAFLSGLFHPIFKTADSATEGFPSINMEISSDKLGFFREDENGDVRPCPNLGKVMNSNMESSSFRSGLARLEPVMQKASELFNISRKEVPKFSWFSDLVVTHICHKHPPMCGPNGCIDEHTKAAIVRGTDWHFTAKYTPPATILAYPTLSKIMQRMILQAGGEEHSKLVLFSTHDSTIIPILVELGISPKEWVSFASRIVFELWEAHGLLANKLSGNELDKHFVRVMYNGKDYTKKLAPCKNSLKFKNLCSLKSFVSFLEAGAQDMGERFDKLCQSTVKTHREPTSF